MVGFVAGEPHREQHPGEVYMLAVDPADQNEGIGAQLTAHACDWIREAGMRCRQGGNGSRPWPRGRPAHL